MIELPNQTFFEPNQKFWETLELYKSKTILDCGCGMGHLIDPAIEQGFKFFGADICYREGQHKDILKLNVLKMPVDRNTIYLVCRPDHSGWVFDLGVRVRKTTSLIYVGLSTNLRRDCSSLFPKKLAVNVGNAGENMYLIN